MNRRKQM